MRNILLLGLMLGLIEGCVTRGPVSEEHASRISKIAVVSDLGDEFNAVVVGTTVFGNSLSKFDVSDWKLNDLAGRYTVSSISKSGRYQPQVILVPELKGLIMMSDIFKAVSTAAEQRGFDTVVLIRGAGHSENLERFLRGSYGLFEIPRNKRCIFTQFAVTVVDVKSKKDIAWEWGGERPCNFGSDNDIPLKSRFEEYSSAEKQLIRSRVEDKLKAGSDYALTHLGLVR